MDDDLDGTIEDFCNWLQSSGHSARTISKRRALVQAYLLATPGYLRAGEADLAAWIASRGPLAPDSATAHRVALACFSSWLTESRRVASAPPPALPVDIDDFEAQLLREGINRRTIRKRLAVVRAFVEDHRTPLQVTEAEVDAWLKRRRLSASTRSTYLGHLRAFYRWARQAGLDPAAELSPRGGPGSASSVTAYGRGRVLLPVTDAWQRAIEDWIDWQASAGRPDTTLYLREYQVRRLGVDNPRLDPFEVTETDLARWLAPMMWSNETRRSYRSALRSFYGWAHATGRMPYDPAKGLPAVKLGRPRARPAPESVVAAALSSGDARTRLMVQLAAGCGMRRAEVASLRTDNLIETLDGPTLRITGKGGHVRLVPIPDHLALVLRALPAGYVFPSSANDHGHLSPHYVGKLLSTALGPGYTAHTLRHRFATVSYAPTQDLLAVQQLLGHASPATTQRYVLTPDATLRALVHASDPLHLERTTR